MVGGGVCSAPEQLELFEVIINSTQMCPGRGHCFQQHTRGHVRRRPVDQLGLSNHSRSASGPGSWRNAGMSLSRAGLHSHRSGNHQQPVVPYPLHDGDTHGQRGVTAAPAHPQLRRPAGFTQGAGHSLRPEYRRREGPPRLFSAGWVDTEAVVVG